MCNVRLPLFPHADSPDYCLADLSCPTTAETGFQSGHLRGVVPVEIVVFGQFSGHWLLDGFGATRRWPLMTLFPDSGILIAAGYLGPVPLASTARD